MFGRDDLRSKNKNTNSCEKNEFSVHRLEIGFVLQVDSSTSDIKATVPLSPNSDNLLDSVSESSGSDISTDGSTTDGSDDLNISPKLNNIPTNG